MCIQRLKKNFTSRLEIIKKVKVMVKYKASRGKFERINLLKKIKKYKKHEPYSFKIQI